MPNKKGLLVLGHGPMFSGKTNWLIKKYGDGSKVIAFKPDIDKRYTANPVLRTHDEKESPAIMVSLSELSVIVNESVRLNKEFGLKKILIDEVNFFPDTIIDIIEDLLARGIDVFVAGLMTDSERKDFGPTRKLAALADKVKQFEAICDFLECNQPAIWSYAKKRKEVQLVVGAEDMYGASCEKHYLDLHIDESKKDSKYSQLEGYGVYPGYISWLENMELPYIRRVKEEVNENPRIEVGGDSMRVGKTTALKAVESVFNKKDIPTEVSLENWQGNPYLKSSYEDSSKVILQSQKWFAKNKFKQLSEIKSNKVHIQDVNPEMDFCYALSNVLIGRMTLKQFEEYVEYYYKFKWSLIDAPDLLIYLKASDEVLVRRAQESAREFETIDESYFLIMKTVNRKWLEGAKKRYRVLEVDTDNFDFSTKNDARNKLGEMVVEKLESFGWSMTEKKKDIKKLKIINGTWEELLGKKLIILSGVPGCGKSYLANKLKKDHGYSYISTDEIRLSKIYKDKCKYFDSVNDYLNTRELTYELLHKTAMKRLRDGKNVVIDGTYLGPQREEMLALLRERDMLKDAIFLVVKTDENTIKSRISLKGKLSNGRDYQDGWLQAYSWFTKKLASNEIRYPDESKDGIKVLEIWNQ